MILEQLPILAELLDAECLDLPTPVGTPHGEGLALRNNKGDGLNIQG